MEGIQRETFAFAPPAAAVPPVRTGYSSLKELKRISNFRLALGWLILGFWFLSILGLDWDAEWHLKVGRDGFWTPPHWLFYSTVTATGVICLAVVLLETFLYYRRFPGINAETTTPILFFFRGPVGFALGGFGMVVMLGSAPLDDYWHRILGIDLKIWTPFHIMLMLGVLLANLGIVYLFASEMNRRKSFLPVSSGPETPGRKITAYLKEFIRPATSSGSSTTQIWLGSRSLLEQTTQGSFSVRL